MLLLRRKVPVSKMGCRGSGSFIGPAAPPSASAEGKVRSMLTSTLQMLLSAIRDRKGVTALEYGVLAAGIIAVIAAIIFTIGTNLKGMFTSVSSQI